MSVDMFIYTCTSSRGVDIAFGVIPRIPPPHGFKLALSMTRRLVNDASSVSVILGVLKLDLFVLLCCTPPCSSCVYGIGRFMRAYPVPGEAEKIFDAIVKAIGNGLDPEQMRKDTTALKEWAEGKTEADVLEAIKGDDRRLVSLPLPLPLTLALLVK